VAGVLDKPYSQLSPLSGDAVQARVVWRADMATLLKLPLLDGRLNNAETEFMNLQIC
jgi:hypothetical protein